MTTSRQGDTGVRWSREVTRATVAGRPSLVYAVRPHALPELLLDARRWRRRTLLTQGARQITFEAHEAAVLWVTRLLRARGIGAQDRVLLIGENQIEWLVAFWALLSVGAVAVLGNAWWSEPELEDAIARIAPRLIIGDVGLVRASGAETPTLWLRDLRPVVDAVAPQAAPADDITTGEAEPAETLDADTPFAAIKEDDPAIILFSSGTTDVARDVVLSHRALIANLHNLLILTNRLPHELSPERAGTVSLLSVPLFHLAGLQVACSTLLSGGRVVFLEGRFDSEQALRLIARERVRVWGCVPTMVERVIAHPQFGAYDTSSLASVQMGGATISRELRARVRAAFPSVRSGAGALYGLTEAGGVLAAGVGAEIERRPGAVGRPLPVVELRIRNPGPDGVGEILARTPSAMSGYWGDASAALDDGWLATGDLGYLDAEGYLYVVGRSKEVIIRGGENISIAHVEQALRAHPAVADVAVVALPHPTLGEEVGAVVRPHADAQPTIAELRAHAAARVARFETPTRWWLRQAPFPLTSTGKIVRREIIREWLERGGTDLTDNDTTNSDMS